MVRTPFHGFPALAGADRAFDLPEDTAGALADGSAQGVGGAARVVVEHRAKLLRVKIGFRVCHAAAQQLVLDADRRRVQEGHPPVVFIISLQKAVRNDAGKLLSLLLPIVNCQPIGDVFKLHIQRVLGRDLKGCCQRFLYRFLILILQLPAVHWAGVGPCPGIRHVKDIAQAGVVPAVVDEGNALRAPFHIAPHSVVPEVILRAGGGFRALGKDHKLVTVRIFVDSPSQPQERSPLVIAAG